MKHKQTNGLATLMAAIVAVTLAAAGCGGGGGGVSSSGGGGGGGNGGGNQPTTTTTVAIRGRVNVPPAADPAFFASRAADKAGPDERGYVPLIGATVTAEGNSTTTTTDSRGAFTLVLTYEGSSIDYPIKITLVKNNIVLKKYVTESAAGLPFQITPQTTAAALAYDRLAGLGRAGLDVDDMEESAYKYTSLPISNIASSISYLLTSGAVVGLTSPVTEQGSVLIRVEAISDVAPPVLDNVVLSDSTVAGGVSVTATVYVQEASGMSDNSSVTLNRQYNQIATAYLDNWAYDASTGRWYASAALNIPDYSATGTCYLSLNLKDSLSNYGYLYSSQDSYHIPSSDFQFETSSRLPSLTISSSSSDTTAPTLISFNATDTTIADAGDTAGIHLTLFENESGISDTYIRFVDQADENAYYGFYGWCGEISPGNVSGEYTCDVTLTDSTFSATGTFIIDRIFLRDRAGNEKSYFRADIENPPEITVSYVPFTTPGTFSIANASAGAPAPGSSVTVSLTLNADKKPSAIYLYYGNTGAEDDNTQTIGLFTTDSSSGGPWTYTGSKTLGAYVAAGTYAPVRANLSGYSQTEGSWSRYFDGNNADDADFLDQLPSFTIASNPHADTESPVYSSFRLAAASFVRGGQFKATATVTDTGYPSYAYINIRHETGNEQNASYYMRCYNVFPGAAAGQWVFEIDETLPANLAAGSWRVNSVSTYDLAGNSGYEQPAGVTFTLY